MKLKWCGINKVNSYMKKLLLFMAFCLSANAMHAQTFDTVNGSSRSGLRADSIAKKVLGTAQYKVGYVYHFSPDSLAPSKKKTAHTLLMVGSQYCSFSD
jgi:hypothetical protein